MKNVLVVDDEEAILLTMAGRFEDYKDQFNVFTAGNGKEAIKVLKSSTIDLVITDLKMPVMDGIELLAYMSTNFSTIPATVPSARRKYKKCSRQWVRYVSWINRWILICWPNPF
jgi:YesN/AraC family two-component response regulator